MVGSYQQLHVSAIMVVIIRLHILKYVKLIHSFIHSLVFSLRGRVGRNQSPVL